MKKFILLTMLSFFSLVAIAQIPPGYYNSADGLTGYELKSALNLIITNGHTDQGYGALYSAYVNGDTDPDDGFVWDMYSEIPGAADPYNYTHNSNTCGNYSAEGDCYNREHIMPQSVFSEGYPMRSDYFNVIPTDGYVNGRRSNYAFGEVSSPTWTSLNGSKVGPCDVSLGYTGTVFEPIDEYKGDIARSLFYFATRYETQVDAWSHPMLNGTENQVFADWFLAVLLKWHQQDPVSTKEIVRNTAGYNYQGNANPFVSHPEWVESIWGEAPVVNLSFTSEPVTGATQDNVYTYNITFEGEAGSVITITKESTDNWLSLTDVTNSSANLTGTPLAANVGTNAVSLKISDGTSEVFQNFSIEVTGSVIPGQDVFFNEIHYDNASTDVDEAIEIAGPAGTDLTGWTIVLYNGSNSSVYNTLNLTGSIPNQQNGYGTVVQLLPSNGLQNGAPDGLALVDASNNVVQFLSYEGVITAADGPAAGMTSTDIGVSETSSTQVGQSLQLTGTGTTYADFVWQADVANTYGAVNTDQFFGSTTIPAVINEFVFNHTGSDTDEFVEIYSNPNTDLSEYTLLEIEGDGSGAGTIDEVITLGTTDANGYYTTAFAANQFENGTVSLLLVKNFTGALSDDLDTDNDGVLDATPWDEIIDDVAVNDGGSGDLTYASVTLTQSFDGSTYTVGGASRIPNGTDTDATSNWVRNDYDGEGLPSFPTAVADEGEAINTPGAENAIKEVIIETTVLINEIDADTEGTDVLEFVELYDGGIGNTPLDGYVLVFYNGSNDLSYAAYDLDGYTTDANGYFVLGNADVANVSIIFSSNGLQNGADAVALYKGDGTDFPNGTAITTTNLEDAIVYDTNDSDDAGLLALLNTDEPQINEDGKGNKDFHSLQRYPNGEGGLRNTSTYTQAIPTPGAANTNATEPINLIINEVDADTEGTDVAEFIELYDGGVGNTSLDGYVVVLYNGNGDASYNAFDLAGYTTNAEGYFVLGNAGVPNVGLVFGSNGLQNGADAVALYTGTAADFPNGTAVTTTNLVDALVYDTNDADDAELLVLLNAGEAQINEGELGDNAGHSNQRIPNGEGGARNTSTYTQATPTPGVANGGGVNPGETITILEARNAVDGATVTISGVLTVADQFNGSAYIQDATGGIAVFDAQVHGAGLFNIGDSLTITGTRSAYNDQIQISPVSAVVNNGLPNQPIVPVDVTLSQLSNYPAQLVRVANTAFPAPGQLLFGNSNYQLTDASGTGELRLDADVTALVGFAQPETCSEIIGVVGRYYEIYQLMPRVAADLPCAEKWQPSGDDLTISKDLTLDVATWNIEWFGDEGTNSPAEDAVQKESAKAVLLGLDADIYAVEEITDDVLFAQMVSEMPGYDFVLSNATSYPDDTGDKQKVGFIYKTSTVSIVSTRVLLESAHPYYNGGDASLLADFPDSDKSRFFASGRLPFMMTADVTIAGTTQLISFIALHARANSSSDPQARYDMRKYDVEALKDTLDMYYANDNIVLLGDYNDDVDETVANISTTVSSYEAYVNDAANYTIPTATLSANGFRSYVFSENMIDHVMVTNELNSNVIAGSARVHYEYYDSDYAYTTSDHLPVSTRLMLETLEVVSTNKTDISCNGNADGSATVNVLGGFEPYTYEWSDGQTTQTAINLVAGTYDVYVTDALGTTVSAQVIVGESAPMVLTMVESPTVYLGYPDAATAELSATEITGGTPDYSYEWSTGATSESIVVEPFETTAYTLTVTDANNCSVSSDVVVNVEDITCGRRGITRVIICYKNRSFCLPVHVAEMFVEYGATLGACNYRTTKSGMVQNADNAADVEEAFVIDTKAYPNPFVDEIKLTVTSAISTDIELLIYSAAGELVHSESRSVIEGKSQLDIELSDLKPGTYILKTIGLEAEAIRIVKE
jgi:endonuclease I/uncharacterized protein YdeI (BOF family)